VTRVQLLTGRVLARLVGNGLIGVAIAFVGTGIHRARPPWGLVLALVIVISGGVLARAWAGWAGMLALALGLVTTVGVLGLRGPGGDVLIAAQPVGYVWYAGAAVVGLAGLLPARWFSDRPGRTRGTEQTSP
jgi:hypothetical protein